MNRRLLSVSVAAALVALLAACTTMVAPTRLQFSISPSGTLGYQISATGDITIAGRNLQFRNSAGAPGVTLTGYRIEFFDQNDGAVNGGDNVSQGSVSLFVPPGFQCDEPDPVVGCTALSDSRYYAPGPEVVSAQAYQLLPAAIAEAHFVAGFPAGWYGDITFTGFDTRGATFTSAPYRLAVAPPD